MSKKQANVPTQNSNSAVIKATLENVDDIISIAVKSAKKSVYSQKDIDKLKSYSEVVKAVFSSNGVVPSLINSSSMLNKFGKNSFDDKAIKASMSNLIEIYNHFINEFNKINTTAENTNMDFSGIKDALNAIKTLSTLKIDTGKDKAPISLKMALVKRNLRKTIKLIEEISKIKVDKSLIEETNASLGSIKTTIEKIRSITTINTGVNEEVGMTNLKIRHVKKDINKTIKLIEDISKIKVDNALLAAVDSSLDTIKKTIEKIRSLSSASVYSGNGKNTSFILIHLAKKNILRIIKLIEDISKIQVDKATIELVDTNLGTIKSTVEKIRSLSTINDKSFKGHAKSILMITFINAYIKRIVKMIENISTIQVDKATMELADANLGTIKTAVEKIKSLSNIEDNGKPKKHLSLLRIALIKKNIKKTIKALKSISKIKVDNTIIESFDDKFETLKIALDKVKALSLIDFETNKNEDKNKKNKASIKTQAIKKNIKKTIATLEKISKIPIDKAIVNDVKDKLTTIKEAYDEVQAIFNYVDSIKIPKFIVLKTFLIFRALCSLSLLSVGIAALIVFQPALLAAQMFLPQLKLVVTMLNEIFDQIHEAKLGPKTLIHMLLLGPMLQLLIPVLYTINEVATIISTMQGVKDTAAIIGVFAMVKGIFELISDTKVGPLMGLRLKRLNKRLLQLQQVILHINKIRIKNNTLKTLVELNLIVSTIGILFLTVTLISPILIVGSLAIWIFVGAVWVLSRAITAINKTLTGRVSKKAIEAITKLMIITALLTAVALMFIVLANIAKPIVLSALWIGGLLLVILLVTASVVAIGYLASSLAAILAPAAVGLLAIVGLIGLFLIIGLMLKALIELELDPSEVKESVKCVMDSAFAVIEAIFDNGYSTNSKPADGVIVKLFKSIGTSILFASQSILSIAFLALTLVSISLILLIASNLKLLEKLDISEKDVKDSVTNVINTALHVVHAIFVRTEADKPKPTGLKFVGTVLKNFGGTLFSIAGAIISIAFLAEILISIVLINLIATNLKLLEKLDISETDVKSSVTNVINTAFHVVHAIFGNKSGDGKKTKKSPFAWAFNVIKNFGGTLFSIAGAIISIAFLAEILIAITLLNVIAAQLKLILKLNLQEKEVTDAVDTILNTAKHVSQSLFNGSISRYDENGDKKQGILKSLLNFIGGPITTIIPAILSISFLTISIISIALVMVLAMQLKKINEIEIGENIYQKVSAITDGADSVSNALFNRKDNMSTTDNASGERKKGFLSRVLTGIGNSISLIASMGWISSAFVAVGLVGKLAESLKTILELPDTSTVTEKSNLIFNTIDTLVSKMNSQSDIEIGENHNTRLSLIDQINASVKAIGDITPSQLKTIDKAFDNYGKFVDKINSIDVNKLETSTKMFEQMSKFSTSIKGDFDNLAKALTENLMPVLEELKEIMEQIPEKLDTGFQNTSASIAATSAPTTRENVEAQALRENPNMTKDEVNKIVDARMAEKSKTESTGVSAKLDELINLLKGYGSENVVVQTV